MASASGGAAHAYAALRPYPPYLATLPGSLCTGTALFLFCALGGAHGQRLPRMHAHKLFGRPSLDLCKAAR